MSDIELLRSHIQKLKIQRDKTPLYQHQVRESITDDIRYYENQINLLLEEVDT